MANTDNLRDLIDIARREISDVPPEVWDRFTLLAGLRFGASTLYVNAVSRKRARLELLAQLDADLDSQTLAAKLGVSVRHAQRLKRLR
ncbi:MAG: hypothetical protein KKF85_03445 [Gammaproteobacteria bacterium]|nr:hypothetical protein [Rhodocyclaceae bacterium]MBU3908878.1 hypothetical protein [Gammaproteobacteria bacterium]MBU3987745.1 hypothetical protein [Gammaproteobacteria bacterium]MBU4003356.1 hypothetical protein [Gammaproteobacteria bacterium]MBU4021827.1 hypothetical protein [Gammaproteobacteria bacterium]